MLAVFCASPAFAVLRIVTNTNDSGEGSLRYTIGEGVSKNEDTIEFDSSVTGTITLTSGSIEIARSVTIIGPGASNLAISGGAPPGFSSLTRARRSLSRA